MHPTIKKVQITQYPILKTKNLCVNRSGKQILNNDTESIKEFLQTKSVWIAEQTSVSNPFIIR